MLLNFSMSYNSSLCVLPGAQTNSGLIMTQAGNLQCKKIIHISAQNNAVVIQNNVKKALEMCAKEKLTSIAFPAIGTGENKLNKTKKKGKKRNSVVDLYVKKKECPYI